VPRPSTPSPRHLVLAAAALFASLCAAPARAGEPLPYAVAPAPAWVTPVSAEIDFHAPDGAARDGVHHLLTDREVRVSDGNVERYVHIARKIVSKSGIESASELTFDVDPPHEKLVLHHIRILRDGHAEDALRPGELHVIQKESDLSQRMYVGTLSIMAFLHDVRVGDIIDYAWSVNGWNPVLGKRYAENFLLGASAPTRHLRVRLLTPLGRSFTRSPRLWDQSPGERDEGLYHETVWDRLDVPALQHEDETPRWFNPIPHVEVTEYRTWADVTAWALPLFESTPRPSPALEAQIQRLRDAAPDEGGRMLAALRFVQDDIRYLGIELGPGSHQPENPSVVLERRFGDCKDKTRLLVTVLRALGIKASPALVNPDLGRGLDAREPTPLAFDHVITRAESGGKTYWLDATMSSQRGGIEALENPDYERALVVIGGEGGAVLTPIPVAVPTEPSVDEVEEINAPRYDAPAEIKVTTRYHGRSADRMRRDVESTDRAEIARRYINFYAREEPSVVEAAPPVITDDALHDTLTIVETYRVPDFWKKDTKAFHARIIANALPSPSISRRSMPLAVDYPTLLAHETRLVLPEAYPIDVGTQDLADATAALHCTTSSVGNSVSIRCRYETKRDFVPVAEVEAHLALVERMRSELGYEITRGDHRGTGAGDDTGWIGVLWVGGIGAGIAMLVVAARFLWSVPRRLKQRAFARSRAIAPGEAASTAILIRSRDEIARHVSRSKCPCGAPAGARAPEPERGEVLFGGRSLTTARMVCPACEKPRSVYFDVAG
jgi:transglutaminase-like putative cysteine protease